MEIRDLLIRRVLDSRGNETVEVEVVVDGTRSRAQAPSGASTGTHEVRAFPEDLDAGISVFRKEVVPRLIGCDVREQRRIDGIIRSVDGTRKLERIGGNIATAASLACARAAAQMLSQPLYRYIRGLSPLDRMPYPLGNVIGGGRHAIGGTDIQEFMAVPMSDRVDENVFANAAVHRTLGRMLKERCPDAAIGKGDEGAWVVRMKDSEALALLVRGCGIVSRETGIDIRPAIDVAASEIFHDGRYVYRDRKLTPAEQVDLMEGMVEEHGLVVVEDPFHEEDIESFAELTSRVGQGTYVVGDDLFVTDIERVKMGVETGAANAVLIKVNQVGTLTDALRTVEYAVSHGYRCIVSHRSGETTDDFIAHLAVGISALGIKTGAVGGERTAKLNELIRIQEGMDADV